MRTWHARHKVCCRPRAVSTTSGLARARSAHQFARHAALHNDLSQRCEALSALEALTILFTTRGQCRFVEATIGDRSSAWPDLVGLYSPDQIPGLDHSS